MAHIEPKNFEKMNVQLAVQLFSNTVADALKYLRKNGIACFKDCEPTEKYTRAVNSLFDIMNAKLPEDGIRPNSSLLEEIKNFMEFLEKSVEESSRTGIPCFASMQTCHSLRITLKSTLEITQYLYSLGFTYALTAKMNQDCLERFFGIIRQSGGGSDHPVVPNFIFLFRLLSLYTPIRTVIRGNVECSEERVLSWIGDCFKSKKRCDAKQRSLKCITDLITEDENEFRDILRDHDYTRSDIDASLVYNFGGYVVRKLEKNIHCEECRTTLLVEKEFCPKEASFTMAKDKGGLYSCSKELFQLLYQVDEHLKKFCDKTKLHGEMYWDIIHNLDKIESRKLGCSQHRAMVISTAVQFILFVICIF